MDPFSPLFEASPIPVGWDSSFLAALKRLPKWIELSPGTRPPARAPYRIRMSQPELAELRKQLTEMLESGIVVPAKSPYGAPALFQKKHDGTLHMCVDYRALNKRFSGRKPIPLIADSIDQLCHAKFYTKKRSGQVRIKARDEHKTTCVTRYGAYEFLVMPSVLLRLIRR